MATGMCIDLRLKRTLRQKINEEFDCDQTFARLTTGARNHMPSNLTQPKVRKVKAVRMNPSARMTINLTTIIANC
jgi:hypothetical protein